MSTLLSSISESMLNKISKRWTTTKICHASQAHFLTEFKMRVMQLKNTLQTMKKKLSKNTELYETNAKFVTLIFEKGQILIFDQVLFTKSGTT